MKRVSGGEHTRVDLGIVAAEHGRCDLVLGGHSITGVARGNLVPLVTVGHGPRQLKRVAWQICTGNTGANIIVEPEVGAGSVNLSIPSPQLSHSDTILGGNRVASITRLDLMVTITVGVCAKQAETDKWSLVLQGKGAEIGVTYHIRITCGQRATSFPSSRHYHGIASFPDREPPC